MASATASPATDSSGQSSNSMTARAHYDANSHSKMMTAARAPEKARRLRFKVARPSPDTLLEDERARLEAFLTRAAPSRVKTSDGVSWIFIVHERAASVEESDDEDKEEWEVTDDLKESISRDWNSGGGVRDLSMS